jgi:hypothetical protein
MFFVGMWMELENVMLNEVSQPVKVKVTFSLMCGRYTCKLNVHIDTYIIFMHICIKWRREQDCISESVWEHYGMWEKERRMLGSEKWNIPSICENNITQCTLSCWIIGNRVKEKVSNWEVNLIKVWYVLIWNAKMNPPWTINIHFQKMKARRVK